MAYTLLTIVHVLVCLFLIVVVLLQSGKAADLAGAFGGMGSQTAFGPRGSATLLSKATTASAVLFMVTSLSLSILATRRAGTTGGSTILDKYPAPTSTKQPASTTTLPPGMVPGAPISVTPGTGAVKPGQPPVTASKPNIGGFTTFPAHDPPKPGVAPNRHETPP